MTIFELGKIALDELYQQGEQESGSELDERIQTQMQYLTQSQTLRSRQQSWGLVPQELWPTQQYNLPTD